MTKQDLSEVANQIIAAFALPKSSEEAKARGIVADAYEKIKATELSKYIRNGGVVAYVSDYNHRVESSFDAIFTINALADAGLLNVPRQAKELTDEEILEKAAPIWDKRQIVTLVRWAQEQWYPDFAAMQKRAEEAEIRENDADQRFSEMNTPTGREVELRLELAEVKANMQKQLTSLASLSRTTTKQTRT
jgi:hypothetical protein